jgi:CheY-like chemotaxis protein
MDQGSNRPRVLVVDDEPFIRRLTARILTEAGYEVVTATDGQEAQEIAGKGASDVDLVLTDIQMPNVDGLQLGRALAVLHPHLPVMYMSGFGAPGVMADIPESQFIAKPFLPDRLLAEVHRMLHLNRRLG